MSDLLRRSAVRGIAALVIASGAVQAQDLASGPADRKDVALTIHNNDLNLLRGTRDIPVRKDAYRTACVPGQEDPSRPAPSAAVETPGPPMTLSTAPPGATSRPLPPGRYKSPGTALGLSLGITLGGIGLAFAADKMQGDRSESVALLGGLTIVIGPTVGHAYAKNGWNDGLKWRLGSAAVATLSLAGALATCPPFSECRNDGAATALAIVAAIGAITFMGATVYEVFSAGESAKKYNASHDLGGGGGVRVGVVPVIGREPGVAVVGRF